MTPRDRRLRQEIAVILIIKLIAITALWWGFIRDAEVGVDMAETARHLANRELPAVKPPQQGAFNAQ